MNADQLRTAEDRPKQPEGKLFTVVEANRALVLVRKVVQDIVRHYRQLMTLRDYHRELASQVGAGVQLERVAQQIKRKTRVLSHLHAELNDIGCVLKDWAGGLVDFPASYAGRRVWLCWRLGEDAITHWHELDTGYSGRQPLTPDFE